MTVTVTVTVTVTESAADPSTVLPAALPTEHRHGRPEGLLVGASATLTPVAAGSCTSAAAAGMSTELVARIARTTLYRHLPPRAPEPITAAGTAPHRRSGADTHNVIKCPEHFRAASYFAPGDTLLSSTLTR